MHVDQIPQVELENSIWKKTKKTNKRGSVQYAYNHGLQYFAQFWDLEIKYGR
jgi:hypothetical protein